MLAAARGELAALETLLAAGAQPDQAGAGGLTALMAAAQSGQPEATAKLIGGGASPDLTDRSGQTALAYAARRGDAETVAVLLAAGARAERSSEQGVSVLMEAARGGSVAVLDRLLNAGADPRSVTAEGQTLLHFAAASSPAMVRRVLTLELDVDVADARGVTPAMRAARGGHLESLQLLVAAGANLALVDAQGQTAFDHARRKKHWPVVDYLEAARTPP
jgi:ankyrin